MLQKIQHKLAPTSSLSFFVFLALTFVSTISISLAIAPPLSQEQWSRIYASTQTKKIPLGVEHFRPSIQVQFQNISHDLFQVWGDTILENDYEVLSDVKIVKVELLRNNRTILGYRLTYEALAKDLMEGTLGVIREAAFVNQDLSSWTVDENAFATFDPNSVLTSQVQ